MISIDHIIGFLRSDTGLWIFWASYTGSMCLLCYSIGREMAWRKFCKRAGIPYKVEKKKGLNRA
jgi:hypothetical protein